MPLSLAFRFTVGELAVPEAFTAVATAAYPIALVFLLVDLLLLVAELGDPLRFHHMLRVFNADFRDTRNLPK